MLHPLPVSIQDLWLSQTPAPSTSLALPALQGCNLESLGLKSCARRRGTKCDTQYHPFCSQNTGTLPALCPWREGMEKFGDGWLTGVAQEKAGWGPLDQNVLCHPRPSPEKLQF